MYLTIQKRRFFIVFLLIVCVWALLQWFYARPHGLIDDWNSWKQAEAQSIAKNYLEQFRLMDPKPSWSGEEFSPPSPGISLYSVFVAGLLQRSPEAEWPGQLLSLSFFLFGALVLFTLLIKMVRPLPALMGGMIFLSSLSASQLSTSVQPETLGCLFYILSFYFFLEFLEDETPKHLLGSAFCSMAAIYISPQTVHLILTQLLLTFFYGKRHFRWFSLWIFWGAMLATFYLSFSDSIHIELPNLSYLVELVFSSTIGIIAFTALIYLLFTKRVNGILIAVGSGILLSLFSGIGNGMDFFLYASFFASLVIAQASDLFFRKPYPETMKLVMSSALAALILFTMGWNTHQRTLYYRKKNPFHQSLGSALKLINRSDDKVIVRSMYDRNARSGYVDPRVFYVADKQGWVIGADMDKLEDFIGYVSKGAVYYVEPRDYSTENIEQWLDINARVVYRNRYGAIYKIMPPPRQISSE